MISFFFSRRRRHTRWPRDWSSDVCSSDLGADGHVHVQVLVGAQAPAEQGARLRVGQLPVGQQGLTVRAGVDRVVGLFPGLREAGVLTLYHGLVIRVLTVLCV